MSDSTDATVYLFFTKGWWEVIGVWATVVAAAATVWAIRVSLRLASQELVTRLKIRYPEGGPTTAIGPALFFTVVNTGHRVASIEQISLSVGRLRWMGNFFIPFDGPVLGINDVSVPLDLVYPVTIKKDEHVRLNSTSADVAYNHAASYIMQFPRLMQRLLVFSIRLRVQLVDGSIQYHRMDPKARRGVRRSLASYQA